MTNTYQPEFDFLACHYVLPFVARWRKKIYKYKRKGCDEMSYVFDKFIYEYIIYSSLVNVIKPEGAKHLNDCAYCTQVMADYIVTNSDKDIINKLSEPVGCLINIIDTKHFSVVSSRNKDPELKKNWEQGSNIQRLTALLETLYYLRCNLFHGQKEYSLEQVNLLKPAGECLCIINKAIVNIYKAYKEEMFNNLIDE